MDRRLHPSRSHLLQLAALTLVLLTALMFGLASSAVMEETAAERTRAYIGNYLEVLPAVEPDQAGEFQRALALNGVLWLALAAAGLSRWGLPLILAVLIVKGFTLGYAVSFLLGYQSGRGALIVLLSLLPHHLLLLPLLLLMSADALVAGGWFSRNRQGRGLPLQTYANWGRRAALYGAVMIVAALVQGYICPLVLHLLFLIR